MYFSCVHSRRDREGRLEQNQHFYLEKLEKLPLDASFTDFRSMRMRLAWLANTRPDCVYEISQLAQVTEERFLTDEVSTRSPAKQARSTPSTSDLAQDPTLTAIRSASWFR